MNTELFRDAVYVVGFWDKPMEYCDGFQDGNMVLVDSDTATIFFSVKAAKEAIRLTKEYAIKEGISTKKGEIWGTFYIVPLFPRCEGCQKEEATIHYCEECHR